MAAGEPWDAPRRALRRRGVVRRRGALRDSRVGRRHPDPECRCLRPRGVRRRDGVEVLDRSSRRVRRDVAAASARFGYRTQRVQGTSPIGLVRAVGSASASRSTGDGAPVRYAELARRLGVDAGEAGAARRRARGGARAASRARAWCSTTPTTTPGRPARSSPTRSCAAAEVPGGGTVVAAAGRPGQDVGCLADRAGGVRQGLRRRARHRRRHALDQAHPGHHQPRRLPRPTTSCCSPAPCVHGVRDRFGVDAASRADAGRRPPLTPCARHLVVTLQPRARQSMASSIRVTVSRCRRRTTPRPTTAPGRPARRRRSRGRRGRSRTAR